MHKVIALHGFLGLPKDFTILKLNNVVAPNLWLSSIGPLERWVKRFNSHLPKAQSILLGYSMGGRLALHCLADNPNLFKAAIIMAAHPGLKTKAEREQRLIHDYRLAENFKNRPWDQLMKDWDASSTLKNSFPVKRFEENYSRSSLANGLRYFSLGQQNDLTKVINQLSLPILWLSPKDESAKVKNLAFKHKSSKLIEIHRGGHRFMFEDPIMTGKIIKQFIVSLPLR